MSRAVGYFMAKLTPMSRLPVLGHLIVLETGSLTTGMIFQALRCDIYIGVTKFDHEPLVLLLIFLHNIVMDLETKIGEVVYYSLFMSGEDH
jgi:hypothetical protein